MLYIISDMNTRKPTDKLQQEIDKVKRDLMELGPMHPGSVSMQHQVCGRAGCRCMDANHPRRHGPYHKLAYVHRGKPVCRFVRIDCADEVKRRVAVYKRFRKLMDRWIHLSVEQAKAEFFHRNSRLKHPSDPDPSSQTKKKNNRK